MNYRDQLKDPRWQKKRLEILQRDNFTCQLCGDSKQTLHVHHNMYEKGSMAWDYDDYLLNTLCSDCHSSIHKLNVCYNDIREVRKKIINGKNNVFIRVESVYCFAIIDDKAVLQDSTSRLNVK